MSKNFKCPGTFELKKTSLLSEHPVKHGENYSIYLHGKVRDRLERKERKGHENIFVFFTVHIYHLFNSYSSRNLLIIQISFSLLENVEP